MSDLITYSHTNFREVIKGYTDIYYCVKWGGDSDFIFFDTLDVIWDADIIDGRSGRCSLNCWISRELTDEEEVLYWFGFGTILNIQIDTFELVDQINFIN